MQFQWALVPMHPPFLTPSLENNHPYLILDDSNSQPVLLIPQSLFHMRLVIYLSHLHKLWFKGIKLRLREIVPAHRVCELSELEFSLVCLYSRSLLCLVLVCPPKVHAWEPLFLLGWCSCGRPLRGESQWKVIRSGSLHPHECIDASLTEWVGSQQE